MARADDIADAVHVLVRLRRDHELQRDVRRRAGHIAEESVPDAARSRHPADAAAFRRARGSGRLSTRVHAVPRSDCARARDAGERVVALVVRGVGDRVRSGLRYGVSGIRRVRDA